MQRFEDSGLGLLKRNMKKSTGFISAADPLSVVFGRCCDSESIRTPYGTMQ